MKGVKILIPKLYVREQLLFMRFVILTGNFDLSNLIQLKKYGRNSNKVLAQVLSAQRYFNSKEKEFPPGTFIIVPKSSHFFYFIAEMKTLKQEILHFKGSTGRM